MINMRWLLYPLIKPMFWIFPEFRLSSYIGSSGRALRAGDVSRALKLASDGLELLENLVRFKISKRNHVMVEISWGFLGSLALSAAEEMNNAEKIKGVSNILRKIQVISRESNFTGNERASSLINRLQLNMTSIDPEQEMYWRSINKNENPI